MSGFAAPSIDDILTLAQGGAPAGRGGGAAPSIDDILAMAGGGSPMPAGAAGMAAPPESMLAAQIAQAPAPGGWADPALMQATADANRPGVFESPVFESSSSVLAPPDPGSMTPEQRRAALRIRTERELAAIPSGAGDAFGRGVERGTAGLVNLMGRAGLPMGAAGMVNPASPELAPPDLGPDASLVARATMGGADVLGEALPALTAGLATGGLAAPLTGGSALAAGAAMGLPMGVQGGVNTYDRTGSVAAGIASGIGNTAAGAFQPLGVLGRVPGVQALVERLGVEGATAALARLATEAAASGGVNVAQAYADEAIVGAAGGQTMDVDPVRAFASGALPVGVLGGARVVPEVAGALTRPRAFTEADMAAQRDALAQMQPGNAGRPREAVEGTPLAGLQSAVEPVRRAGTTIPPETPLPPPEPVQAAARPRQTPSDVSSVGRPGGGADKSGASPSSQGAGSVFEPAVADAERVKDSTGSGSGNRAMSPIDHNTQRTKAEELGRAEQSAGRRYGTSESQKKARNTLLRANGLDPAVPGVVDAFNRPFRAAAATASEAALKAEKASRIAELETIDYDPRRYAEANPDDPTILAADPDGDPYHDRYGDKWLEMAESERRAVIDEDAVDAREARAAQVERDRRERLTPAERIDDGAGGESADYASLMGESLESLGVPFHAGSAQSQSVYYGSEGFKIRVSDHDPGASSRAFEAPKIDVATKRGRTESTRDIWDKNAEAVRREAFDIARRYHERDGGQMPFKFVREEAKRRGVWDGGPKTREALLERLSSAAEPVLAPPDGAVPGGQQRQPEVQGDLEAGLGDGGRVPEAKPPETMTLAELRTEAQARGIDPAQTRPRLVRALREASSPDARATAEAPAPEPVPGTRTGIRTATTDPALSSPPASPEGPAGSPDTARPPQPRPDQVGTSQGGESARASGSSPDPIAARPQPRATERIVAKLDDIEAAARDRIRKRQLPRATGRGARAGGTTLGGDIVDVSLVVATRAVKAGIRGGEALARMVEEELTGMAPHLEASAARVRRAAEKLARIGVDKDGRKDEARFERAVAEAMRSRGAMRRAGAEDAAVSRAEGRVRGDTGAPDRIGREGLAKRLKARVEDVRSAAMDPEFDAAARDADLTVGLETAFYGKMPSELREAVRGNPGLRRLIRENDPNGRGGDSFAELGADEYLRRLEMMAGSDRAKDIRAASMGEDPVAKFYAHTLENWPGKNAPEKVRFIPARAEPGTAFTINGEPALIVDHKGERGVVHMGGPDFAAKELGAIGIDRGSARVLDAGRAADLAAAIRRGDASPLFDDPLAPSAAEAMGRAPGVRSRAAAVREGVREGRRMADAPGERQTPATGDGRALRDQLARDARTAERAFREGNREGRRVTREEAKQDLATLRSKMAGQAKMRDDFRTEARRIVQSSLPKAARGEMLTSIENAKTPRALLKTIEKVGLELARYEGRDAAAQVQRLTGNRKLGKLTNERRDEILAMLGGKDRTQFKRALETIRRGEREDAAAAAERMQTVLAEVRRIQAENAAEFKAHRDLRGLNLRGAKEVVRRSLGQRRDLAGDEPPDAAQAAGDRGPDFNPARRYIRQNLTLEQVMLDIDGVSGTAERGGIAHTLGFKRLEEGQTRKLGRMKAGREAMDRLVKRAGFDSLQDALVKATGTLGASQQKFIDVQVGPYRRITLDQALAVYAMDADATARLDSGALAVLGRGEGQKTFALMEAERAAIVAKLTPEQKAMVDAIKAEIFERQIRPDLFAVLRRMTGAEPPAVDGYFPITVAESMGEMANLDRVWSVGGDQPAKLENAGFTRPRQGGGKVLLVDGFFSTMIRHLDRSAAVIELAEPVRDAASVLLTGDTRRELARRLGSDTVQRVERALQDVGTGPPRPESRIDRASNTLTGLTSRGLTQINPASWLIQVGGTSKLLGSMDARDLAAGSKAVYSKRVTDLLEADPDLWFRYQMAGHSLRSGIVDTSADSKGTGFVRAARATGQELVKGRVGQAGRNLRTTLDQVAVAEKADQVHARLAIAAADRQVARESPGLQGAERDAAVMRIAKRAIFDTLNTFDPVHQSGWQQSATRSATLRPVAAFTSDAVKSYNLIRQGFRESSAKGVKAAAVIAASALVSGVLRGAYNYALERGGAVAAGNEAGEEDRRDRALQAAASRFAVELSGTVFGLDKLVAVADAAFNKRQGNPIESPAAGMLVDLANAAVDVTRAAVDAVVGEEPGPTQKSAAERFVAALGKLATAGTTAAGLPGVPAASIYNRVKRGATRKHSEDLLAEWRSLNVIPEANRTGEQADRLADLDLFRKRRLKAVANASRAREDGNAEGAKEWEAEVELLAREFVKPSRARRLAGSS